MKVFGRVFKRKKRAKKNAKPDALGKINGKIESLRKRNLKIEHKLAGRQALSNPKRMRRQEKKLRLNNEKILKLENQVDDLEHKALIAKGKSALKFASKALTSVQMGLSNGHGTMNVTDVLNDFQGRICQVPSSIHQNNVDGFLPKLTKSELISKLNEAIEPLEKKSAYIEERIEEEGRTAKENVSKNERLAHRALKRKLWLKMQLKKLDGAISKLELQVSTLENANTNAAMFNSMKQASEALESAHMEPDRTRNNMACFEEQKERQVEISEALSSSVQYNLGYEDDDLLPS